MGKRKSREQWMITSINHKSPSFTCEHENLRNIVDSPGNSQWSQFTQKPYIQNFPIPSHYPNITNLLLSNIFSTFTSLPFSISNESHPTHSPTHLPFSLIIIYFQS